MLLPAVLRKEAEKGLTKRKYSSESGLSSSAKESPVEACKKSCAFIMIISGECECYAASGKNDQPAGRKWLHFFNKHSQSLFIGANEKVSAVASAGGFRSKKRQ